MPIDEPTRYAELEAGARYLAAEAGSASERDRHLGAAETYARRRRAAVSWGRD